MALGKRAQEQQELWIPTTELPRSPGHPFYQKLNQLLAENGFDRWLEKLCAAHYAEEGRPSIPPGVYFRMLLVGYFEGIQSQRGIAWRCSDSRSLAAFLGVPPTEPTPEHSSLTRIRQRLPSEVGEAVFARVLGMAAAKKLLDGQTVAVDSTTLEANAAMKSIVRKDTGEDYKAYLRRLAAEDGLEDLSDEELRRYDKNRPNKKVSNAEWQSETDADSRIMKMKDGTTHLAYKAEHVVDVNTDLVLGVTVHPGDAPDTETLVDSVLEAQGHIRAAGSPAEIRDVTADKGYHAADTLALAAAMDLRTYIPEPERHHQRCWQDKPAEQQAAVYANRRRVRGARSKKLQRLRSELTERSFAHVCETGGGRRCWLRGLIDVAKRYVIMAVARNLGLLMRKLFGVGTPRSLQRGGGLFVWTHGLAYWLSARLGRLWGATRSCTPLTSAA